MVVREPRLHHAKKGLALTSNSRNIIASASATYIIKERGPEPSD